LQGLEEVAPEKPYFGIAEAELILHPGPGDELGPRGVNTTKALGEPFVDIQSQGVMGERAPVLWVWWGSRAGGDGCPPHAENGGGDCRGLALEKAQLLTIGVSSPLQAFDKGRHAVFEFNFRTLSADRLGVQVDEDQPGGRSERNRKFNPFLRFGVHRSAGLDAQEHAAVFAEPGPLGRLPVRESRLAKISMLKSQVIIDRLELTDGGRCVDLT